MNDGDDNNDKDESDNECFWSKSDLTESAAKFKNKVATTGGNKRNRVSSKKTKDVSNVETDLEFSKLK